MFNLYDAAVDLLDNSEEADPKKLAGELLKKIPVDAYAEVVEVFLPLYLTNTANALRHRTAETIEGLVEAEVFANATMIPAGLAKAPTNGLATGFAAQVQQQKVGKRLFINSETREWKWYEDTTRADWEAVAADRQKRAQTSLKRSENANRAVDLFDKSQVTSYADLNEAAREEINNLDV